VVRYAGRWYVVGHDADRGAERVFRLSRVQGAVRTVGPPGAYDVPPDTDVREIARRLAPPTSTERAVLLVRHGAGHAFRRNADRIETGVAGPDHASAWDRVEITRRAVGLADDVLAQGADVVLLEPVAVRKQVIARLEQVTR
ncbi:WYL domain-containing protein, partial [Nocardioides sp. GCM10030258]